MRGAQTGDRVSHQQRVIANGANQFRDSLNIVTRSGRAFGRLHIHDFHIGRELSFNFCQRKSLAVRDAQHIHIASEGFRQIAPALAELSGGQHQDLVSRRGQVRNRAFHHSGTGRSQHQHVILRADEVLHVGEHAGVQRLEISGAVMGRIGRHGRLSGRQQGRRAGSEEAILKQHFLVILWIDFNELYAGAVAALRRVRGYWLFYQIMVGKTFNHPSASLRASSRHSDPQRHSLMFHRETLCPLWFTAFAFQKPL